MKTFYGLLLLSICPALALAAGPKVRAFWATGPEVRSYEAPLTEDAKIDVIVQLKSSSNASLRVFCKQTKPFFGKIPSGGSGGGDGGIIVYRIGLDAGLGGIDVVPSIAELRPVDLLPGDVTEFRFSVRVDRGTTLRDVTFRYQVMEAVGKRFDGWFGAVDVPVQRQTMNMPWLD